MDSISVLHTKTPHLAIRECIAGEKLYIKRHTVNAAEWMKEGGMDGVEVMTHGHLLDQFISPLTNRLEGPDGVGFAGRMKLTMDIIKAVRARVGREYIVGVRFTVTERLKGIQRDGNRLKVMLGAVAPSSRAKPHTIRWW